MYEVAALPRPIASAWEWQQDAACRDLPTEMFFHPDGERGPNRRNRVTAAKAVCTTCPVIQACRKQALAFHEPYGIWGGMSEEDRLNIISQRQDPQAIEIAS